ncbi:glucans biosynthesis glucosyltransferase MdoH [Thiohalocapsa marina]|uniref:Glucans biosynthesis glucosyltransferase H n=2 Tax=Thiohalocapsa marina TaxID=424902 RepID=A0A5M8FHH6_9GAMM|nr:glucans biosynthesis glucosyltransferase MdoH [Thiohalocapsa marina]
MTRRRRLFLALVVLTMVGVMGLMGRALSVGGFTAADLALGLLFLVTLPWTVIGFWNAVIGFLLMRRHRDPARAVFAGLARADDQSAIRGRTAILCCIRNEDVAMVRRNLDAMIGQLLQSGAANHFAFFVLSDSDWDEVVAAEAVLMDGLRERWGSRIALTYRRRERNPGFKAGNVQEFCRRWGHAFDYMLVLDADSLMDAPTLLRMVRTLDQRPEVGILQSLVVGLPSASAFARPFQFGMRLGMKSYSLGSAWWQGDAGPYWGHNALIRVAPFTAHCHLPRLRGDGPLSGWILSHDQVEAVLMRRAGYEVRVMAAETGSWEENPTTLIEFIRRDLRWCQGNLQYLRLLGPGSPLCGLAPVSRVQLLLAVLMFVASPAWVAFMLYGAWRIASEQQALFDPLWGAALLWLMLGMIFAPKLASLLDAVLDKDCRRRYGGTGALLLGGVAETLFTALIAPIMAIAHSLFIGGLLFGRAIVWGAQRRQVHGVQPATALRRLWPQTLIGALALGWLAWSGPGILLLFSPFYIGALLAVPLAVISARPGLGRTLARLGLWCIPDETEPEPMLRALGLDALAVAREAPRTAVIDTAARAHPPRPALRPVTRGLRPLTEDAR